IRQACRAAVPEALRAWLHGRIAAALEAQHAAPGRIAPHARAAGELRSAGTQFRAAADAARAAGRLSEEVRLLATAAECFDELGDRPARFESLARRAMAALEALPPAQAMEAAEALVDAAAGDRELGIALRLVGACHLNGARFERAAPELERAIECSERGGDTDSSCHARYLLALTVVQTQGAAPALERIESLLAWAESQPDIGLRHAFIADLAILLDQADQRRRARPHFERALAYFDAVRAVGDAASTRMMFARSLGLLGDLAQACALLEVAEREREALSEGAGGQGIEALNLGRAYCELGRYDEALRLLEPTRQRLAEGGTSVVGTAVALVMARVLLHLGQGARAQALCAEPGADAPFHQRATWLWTCALLALERPAERTRLLGAAEREFERTDLPFVRLPIQFDRLGSEAADDAAVASCRLLINECERRELPAPQMLGRARLAQLLLAQRELDTALTVVRGLQADLASCHPVGMYLPELHWICHRVAHAAGDSAFAAHCLDAAVRWIRDTALPHVPAPYRDSFVRRQPINRRILAAASLL
ncbi:MAG TPA: hypothetical protein VFA35_06780, partial [Burkholderiaceae bacterium]|nr:hypothetical protein [Burkholderiaceae bacterium]